MKKLIKNIYHQKNDFIVIGLTGKTGSGCTTISNILKNGYTNYSATNCKDKPIQNRKDNIIKNFASKNFIDKKFEIIKPSTVIMMLFIFEKSIFFTQIKVFKELLEMDEEKIENIKKEVDGGISVSVKCKIDIECTVSIKNKIKEESIKLLNLYKAFVSFDINNKLDNESKFEDYLNNLIENYSDENKSIVLKYIKKKKNKYEKRLLNQTQEDLISEINNLFGSKLKCKNKLFKNLAYKKITSPKNYKNEILKKFKLKREIISKVLEYLAKNKSSTFIELYNKYNTTILEKRNSKELSIPQLQVIGDLVREKIDIFQLPEYINLLIKSYRKQSKAKDKHCYIAIDSLKNPFEILFFKERYSAYYTFSIHATDETIYERFLNTDIDIKSIHKKELNKDNTDEQKGSLDSKKDFNSQNIIECISLIR